MTQPDSPIPETPRFDLPILAYKPGWTFEWGEQHGDGGVWLTVHVEGPDAKGLDREDMTARSVDFAFVAPMPFDPSWLRNRIAGIEDHEINEWLRIDGRLEFDPHA